MDKKYKKIIIVIVSILILILLSFLLKYLSINFSLSVPCVFHELTGLLCPGCGMTRAVFSLLELDIVSCFKNNLLLVILIPIGIYYLIKFIYYYINDKDFKNKPFFNQKMVLFLLIIAILFGLFRNFDYFYFLRPI